MDYMKESLRLHEQWGGKIEMTCRVPLETRDDLSLAYTPGWPSPAWKFRSTRSKAFPSRAGATRWPW